VDHDARDEEAEHEQEAEPEQEQRGVARKRDHLEHGCLGLAGDDDAVAPGRDVRNLSGQCPVGADHAERDRPRRSFQRFEHDRARRRPRDRELVAHGGPPGVQGDGEQEEGDCFQTAAEGIPSETRKGELMGHQTVQEAMTSNPTAITPDTTAQEAARLLKSDDVGSLPIVEEGRLIGVVTDRDLALRVLAEGRGLDTPVRDLASKNLVTIDPQEGLDEAARLMAKHQVRRLPVVEEDSRLVGMLAQADVAQAGHDTLTGDVVQKISQ
jgi:CBS domain-containing protein